MWPAIEVEATERKAKVRTESPAQVDAVLHRTFIPEHRAALAAQGEHDEITGLWVHKDILSPANHIDAKVFHKC
jgi:hypothetical protein